MRAYDVMQVAIVTAAVLASGLYMLGQLAPGWRGRLALRLQQSRYPRWLNAVGVRIAGGSGCGGGCDTCGTCGPKATKKK